MAAKLKGISSKNRLQSLQATDPQYSLSAEINKLQRHQIDLQKQIEKYKEDKSKNLKSLEEEAKIVEIELQKKRKDLLLLYKTLKSKESRYQTLSTSSSSGSTTSSGAEPSIKLVMSSMRLKKKVPPSKYNTNLLDLYNDPKKELEIDGEDEAAALTNNLMRMSFGTFGDGSIGRRTVSDPQNYLVLSKDEDLMLALEEKKAALVLKGACVREFASKTELNKVGLGRANKDKTLISADGKKEYANEDESICICPFNNSTSSAVFGILDGHSGANAAKYAKQFLPEELLLALKNKKKTATTTSPILSNEDCLIAAFETCDRKMASAFPFEGCTATIAFIWCVDEIRYLQVANVGDSLAFLHIEGDDILPLTEEHKVTNPNEKERIKKMGLELSENATRLHGLAVSRSLGDHCLKQETTGLTSTPSVGKPVPIPPNKRGTLILASDGLWDVFSPKKCFELMEEEHSAAEKAKKLIQSALNSSKCQDNVTVVVVCL